MIQKMNNYIQIWFKFIFLEYPKLKIKSMVHQFLKEKGLENLWIMIGVISFQCK